MPVERAARDLRLAFPQDFVRLSVNQIAASSAFFPALETLRKEFRSMIETLESQAERADTIEYLANAGCQVGQGYYWSRPVPAAELDGWLAADPGPVTSGAIAVAPMR